MPSAVDVFTEGFGASSAFFASVPAGDNPRLVRTIRASQARVDIRGIDVTFALSAAPAASRTFGVGITVFRAAQGTSTDKATGFFITAGNVPVPGLETLWFGNFFGVVTNPSTIPGNLSMNEFRFPEMTLWADQSKILYVVATCALAADGAANVASFVGMSVIGLDHAIGSAFGTATDLRSLPKTA